MVLEMWQYEAAPMKAEKFAMGGAIHRLNRKLLMAWEQWQKVLVDHAVRIFPHQKMYAA